MRQSGDARMRDPYFIDPPIPARFFLVLGAVFLSILAITAHRLDQSEARNQKLLSERNYVLNDLIPNIEERIEVLKQDLCAREKQLKEAYRDMEQNPPEWPDKNLIAGGRMEK